MPRKILLTGSRHFVAIREARMLYADGCEVYTADSVNFDYTMYSKAVKQYFRVPSVRFEETKYIETLCRIVNENKIDEIVALGEETFYLAKNIQTIRKLCPKAKLKIDSLDKLTTLHNKWLFYKLSTSLHLPVPKTAKVKSPMEVIEWQKRFTKHSVIKPVYSRFGHETKELQVINKSALADYDWQSKGGYIIQEFIKGEPISSFSMSSDDDAVITYKSALVMSGPGAMAAARRVETPKLIRDIDTKIRKKLNYSGQLGLDFLCTSDGKLILLEANPRATVGRILLRQDKIQFRIMMLHQFLNGYVPVREWLKYSWAMTWYPDTVWSWMDIKPAFMSQIMSKGLGTYLQFLSQHPGVGFQAYSTYDMEYNGDKTQNFKVEKPTKNDDKSIMTIIESLSRKGMFDLIFARRPSPLLSFDHEKTRLGLIKDFKRNIAYMCACTRNMYYINGKPSSLGYLSAVRKNPTYNGFIDWRMLFYNYFGEKNYFFSVLKSNLRAIQAFTRSHATLISPRLITNYKMMIINARRIEEPVNFECEFKNTLDVSWTELLKFINKEGSKYNFFPVVTELLLRRLGITNKNSFVLVRNGKIVGFAGLVDQRKWKQFIIVHYALVLRYVRIPFNIFARKFRYISIPKQGKPIACPTVTLLVVAGDDQNLYKELVYGLAVEAKKKADVFLLAVSTDSPHHEFLNTKYNLKIENDLYLQETDKKLTLGDKSVYVDALMLY